MSVQFGPITHLKVEHADGRVTDEPLQNPQHGAGAANLLVCSLCLEQFVYPYSLATCTHTFCRECILHRLAVLRIQNNYDAFPCPLCRAPCTRPQIVFNRTLDELIAAAGEPVDLDKDPQIPRANTLAIPELEPPGAPMRPRRR